MDDKPSDQSAMVRRNFFIPPALYDSLQTKARITGTNMSEHVRMALTEYLKDEDTHAVPNCMA